MILKSSNFLYVFDLDGTVAGSDNWQGFFKNCKLSFRQLHINPDDLDIRWILLTSRPTIDRLLVKLLCWYHKLNPKHIIMGPTFRYKFKSKHQEAEYKSQILKDILDEKIKLTYTDAKIEKICYIDNNIEITKKMNDLKNNYSYLAMSVPDFLTRNLEVVLL